MTVDKYGVGQDPYCYPGTSVLRNHLNLRVQSMLDDAERELSSIAASEVVFHPPPYDLSSLQALHRHLFKDIYPFAGKVREVDISKGATRFCNVSRIEPEAAKLFAWAGARQWFQGLERPALMALLAEFFGELNMLHPFREGNGRAQRLLFEQLVIAAEYPIDWRPISPDEWIHANISAVACNYAPLADIFDHCIGQAPFPS